jgi:hypothetical protein
MPWSVQPPKLGSSFDEEPEDYEHEVEDGVDVDTEVELPREIWSTLQPDGHRAETVAFVDGVQRVDGDFTFDDGVTTTQGRFLSMAAGMVYCNGSALIDPKSVRISRVLLAMPPMADVLCGPGIEYKCDWLTDFSDQALLLKTHRLREELEVAVAKASPAAELVVIDGHLQHREAVENAIGYLKTQRQRYLPPEQHGLIRRLAPGERTPVFLIKKPERYSWYARLPHKHGLPLPGIVRYEASSSLTGEEAVRLAKLAAATLPRFASEPHKDDRAPQNLYPIGGLERDLRRRLGDQALLMRSLMRAQATQA